MESVDLRSAIRKADAVLPAFARAGQRGDTLKSVAWRGGCRLLFRLGVQHIRSCKELRDAKEGGHVARQRAYRGRPVGSFSNKPLSTRHKYSNTSTRELFNSYHNSSHSRSSRSCSSWSTSSSAPSPPGGCGAARTEGGRRGGSDAFGPSSGMVDLCSPRRTAPVPPPLAGAGAGAGLCPVPSLGRRSRSNCSRSSSWLGLGLGLGYI